MFQKIINTILEMLSQVKQQVVHLNYPKMNLQVKKVIISKFTSQNIVFTSDVAVSFLSLYLTLRLLLGDDFQTLLASLVAKYCFVFAFVSFSIFSWGKTYQGKSRYVSLDNIQGVLGCALLANLLYHPLMMVMGCPHPLTPLVNTVLFMIGLSIPRLMIAYWARNLNQDISNDPSINLLSKMPVMVVGYNEQIGRYLRTQSNEAAFPYFIMGILLNEPLNEEDLPPSYPILGMVIDFVSVMQKVSADGQEPKRFLVSHESLKSSSLRQILLKFLSRGILSLRFDVVPASHEVTLRSLNIEDFLTKPSLDRLNPDKLNPDPARPSSSTTLMETLLGYGGKTCDTDDDPSKEIQFLIDSAHVLITGVSDLVTHHLARQIAGYYPKHMVLVDSSEGALVALKLELDQMYPDVMCEYVVASLLNHGVLEGLIKTHHPQIIIQGDRLVNPQMIAANPIAAVQKNIFSALRLAEATQNGKVHIFVQLIGQSPTTLTKGINTIISQAFQTLDLVHTEKYPTRFLVVNTGDVWDSLDSVTARWSDQLNQGLTITIPSPDAYAYLLSAKDAAFMILQTIVKAQSQETTRGKAYYLCGSEPARFLDLICPLTLLKGLIPEIDGKVNFSQVVSQVIHPSYPKTLDSLPLLIPGVAISEEIVKARDLQLNKLADLCKEGKSAEVVACLERRQDGGARDKIISEPDLSLKRVG